MRFVVTLRDGRPAGSETEAIVDADPRSPVADLMSDLLLALEDDTDPAMARNVALWVDAVAVDPSEHTVRSAGIRPGSVLEVHASEEPAATGAAGVAELRVVNGPGAGRVHRLGLGSTVIGREAPGLSLPDERLAPDALTVVARPGGAVEVIPAPGLEVTIDGADVSGRSAWLHGGYLIAGDTVLELTAISRPDGQAHPDANGLGLDVTRRVRSGRPASLPHLVLPARPSEGSGRRHLAEWLQAREDLHIDVVDALDRETRARRMATPDPAAVLLTAVGPGRRLWERHPLEDDWLQLRIGLAAQPPRTVIDDRDGGGPVRIGPTRWHARTPRPLPALLMDVPATVNLQAVSVLGLVGDAAATASICRWLIGQCATFHAPEQLRIAVLTTHDYAARKRWEWVARLPHARPDEGSGVSVLIGNETESVQHRLAELQDLIDLRTQPRRAGARPIPSIPEVVVVLDGIERLSRVDGVSALLIRGREAGVHVICVGEQEETLPPHCRAVITCSPQELTFHRADSPRLDDIHPDLVEGAWAERLSRALAPLRVDAAPQSATPEAAAPEPVPVLAHPAPRHARTAGPTAVGPIPAPHAWAVTWDDIGYPSPSP